MAVRIHTFLYTDLADSTPEWELDPVSARVRLDRHHALVGEAVSSHGGRVFKSLGDGLASVFPTAHDAIAAAHQAQAACRAEGLRVRMAVHSGPAEEGEMDFHGHALNRVGRLCATAASGQVLVSVAARDLAQDLLAVPLAQAGAYLPKGSTRHEEVWQVSTEQVPAHPILTGYETTNLVPYAGAFFGRVRERKDLTERLCEPGTRLVTLLGFGGIGKTTLARVVAADLLDAFPSGVWWVPCESLTSAADIMLHIAQAAGLPVDPLDPQDGVARALRKTRCLIILDCFEGLVSQAEVVGWLASKCSNVNLLVTSRVVLGLGVEHTMELQGMRGQKGSAQSHEAEALFEDAAKRARNDLEFGPRDRKIVREIVRALDYLPLALEIAAGRLRYVTLPELAAQVKASLLAAVKRPGLPPGRHSGLRQVIEASYRLLAEGDREAAARLSVFEGGFALEQAVALLSDPLDPVARLRDHSLLTQETTREGSRYRELDSVREYFRETVPPKTYEDWRASHASAFLPVAQRVRTLFDAGDLAGATRLATVEQGNFRAALAFSRDPELAFQLCRPWLEIGFVSDFQDGLPILLESSTDHCREEGLGLRFANLFRRSEFDAALDCLAVLAKMRQGKEGEGELLVEWASVASMAGDWTRMREGLDRLAALGGRATEDDRRHGRLLEARYRAAVGDKEAARDLVRSLDDVIDALPPGPTQWFGLRQLGQTKLDLGDPEGGRERFRQLLSQAIESGFAHAAGTALAGMLAASLSLSDGDADRIWTCLHVIPDTAWPQGRALRARLAGRYPGLPPAPRRTPGASTWVDVATSLL